MKNLQIREENSQTQPKNPRAADDYSDIINLPRPIPKSHRPLSRFSRAAQFAPFAALTGHSELIADDETAADTKSDPNYEIILDS